MSELSFRRWDMECGMWVRCGMALARCIILALRYLAYLIHPLRAEGADMHTVAKVRYLKVS